MQHPRCVLCKLGGSGYVKTHVFVSYLLGWWHASATVGHLQVTKLYEEKIYSMRTLVVVLRIGTTANVPILYIFVTWRWPAVAETCRQPNKYDTKTVGFWRTYSLLMYRLMDKKKRKLYKYSNWPLALVFRTWVSFCVALKVNFFCLGINVFLWHHLKFIT